MSQKYPLTILALALLALTFVSACRAATPEPPPAPVANVPPLQVWLEWPADGSEHPLQELEVQAQAHDPSRLGLAEVQLFINGDLAQTTKFTGSTSSLVYAPLRWQPSAPGDYIVEVRAVNRAGLSSDPAQARVTIAKKEVKLTFTADNPAVKYGNCTTLRWTAENVQEVKLDGQPVDFAGSREVCPKTATPTYHLTALSLYGERVEQTVTLTVPPTPLPPKGVDIDFEADATTVTYGQCTTLRWNVKNAQGVQLEGPEINLPSIGLEGSQSVCPTAPSNTYRLTAQSLDGKTAEQIVIITVPATPTPTPTPTSTATPTPTITPTPTSTSTPIPPTATFTPTSLLPPQLSLIASSTSINRGQCATLSWHTEHVKEAHLRGGGLNKGLVGSDGTEQVCPTTTTPYELQVILPDGRSDTRSVQVNVIQPSAPSAPPVLPPPSDTQKPTIISVSPAKPIAIGTGYCPKAVTIIAEVTDNQGVVKVELLYDQSGYKFWGTPPKSMSLKGANSYEYTLVAPSDFEETTVWWWIRATDAAGNYTDSGKNSVLISSGCIG